MVPTPSLVWTSRFAGRPRLLAAALGVVALLALWAATAGASIDHSKASPGDDKTDLALYQAVVERMNDGQGYYQAAAIELPARSYPTTPVPSVREPTLAWFISTVGRPVAVAVMLLLAMGALALSLRTFELTERSRRAWIGATVLAAAGVGILCQPKVVEQHEVWAALLVYLGLLVRGNGKVVPAVVLLLTAAVVRELVAPVMAIMLVVALLERRRREAGWWLAALVVFAGFYGWHAWQVHGMTGPAGPESPGWLAMGGWPFVVDAFWGSSLLTVLPHSLAAIVVPMALLGWFSRSGTLFDRVSAVLLAYVVLFCFAGREDNYYWGMLVGSLLLPGFAFGLALCVTALGGLRPGVLTRSGRD